MICTVIREYVLQKMRQLFNMKYISILATFTVYSFIEFYSSDNFIFFYCVVLCFVDAAAYYDKG